MADGIAGIDFTARQGDGFRRTLTFTQGETPESAEPLDFTGMTASMQVRERAAAEDAVITLAPSIDGGTITIEVSGSELAGVEPRRYGYDLVIDSGTERRTLAEGDFTVEASWTRQPAGA